MNILDKINNLDGVKGRIRLKNGEILLSQKLLTLNFYADFGVDEFLKNQIYQLIKQEILYENISLDFQKVVALKQFVCDAVGQYLNQAHKAICTLVNNDCYEYEKNDYQVNLQIRVEKSVYDYMKDKKIDLEIKEYLQNTFVDDFTVLIINAGDVPFDLNDLKNGQPKNELYKREKRTFKVDEVTRLFDNDTNKTCYYICDTKNYIGDAYVAGIITRIEERETKNAKPFFIIEISDRTGVLSGTCFPTKDKLPKMRKLSVGSEIIASGDFLKRGDYINFTFRNINLCIFPKNFVPQERVHRLTPSEYTVVFPKPIEIEEQDNFLIEKTIPDCFIGRSFVVFDLETTGIDQDDKITEIGAVKLIDGKPTEYFSTLVNPCKHIPQEVQDLTGIDEKMVKDAPKFEEVCGDFYKFCHGSTLVAHNIDFDSRFIKKQGEAIDYYFDHPLMDTLSLARECIFDVSNYKLNTLCAKFGIVFRHHRAYSDALATSELFIEIIKIRKSLPF